MNNYFCIVSSGGQLRCYDVAADTPEDAYTKMQAKDSNEYHHTTSNPDCVILKGNSEDFTQFHFFNES